MGIINLIKRPFVGDQTTGRDAFLGYQSYALAGVNGDAGFTVKGQIAATYPAGIAPGPTHKLNDPSATGNNSSSVELLPLSDTRNI